MKKRTLALILALVMVLSLGLTACGGSGDTTTTEPADTAGEPDTAPDAAPTDTAEKSTGYEDKTGIPVAYATDVDKAVAYAEQFADFYNLATPRDKLVVSASQDGGGFEPTAIGSFGVLDWIFPKFVSLDSGGNLINIVAKSIVKQDDLTYRITIWENIVDTDGNPFTTSDVEFCFQKMVDAGRIDQANRYDHLEIIDDYTFDFCLNGDTDFGVGEMAANLGAVPLYTQAACESHDFINDPVGIGGYMLKPGSYIPNSGFSVVTVDNWWFDEVKDQLPVISLTCLRNVKEIEYKILTESSSRAIGLELGDLDICDALDLLDAENLISNGFQKIQLPGNNTTAISFNSSEFSPCGDINLRMAICYAIDNAAFAAGVNSPATPAYGMYPTVYDALPEWSDPNARDYYDYNVEKAKELLAESSYDGTPLKMMYTSMGVLPDTALMVEAALREVGINVEHMQLEQTVILVKMFDKTAFDFKIEAFGGPGGNYMPSRAKIFTAANNTQHFDNGEGIHMVASPDLDELVYEIARTDREDDIRAWDELFTYEYCYGYGILTADSITAASADLNVCQDGAFVRFNACY